MSGLTLNGFFIPMKLDIGKTEFGIDVSFAVCVTLMLILDESGLGAIALFCSIIHEAAHIACLRFFGEKPASVRLSFYGIKLERVPAANLGRLAEIAVYASGPAANIIVSALLFLFSLVNDSLETAAVISLMIGIFNLIPCCPLDGGNILKCIIDYHFEEEKVEKIVFAVSFAVVLPMTAAAVCVFIKTGNPTLLLVTAYILFVTLLNKSEKEYRFF